MRDLGHLEELSSTAAVGLWADDVVIALDRALSGSSLSEASRDLLGSAAGTLKAAAEETEHPMEAPKSARALAATDSAMTAAAALVQDHPEEDIQRLLLSMSETLERAAAGRLSSEDSKSAKKVIDLFGLLGERQLMASNSVLTSRKEARAWTGAPATSSFS
jgi:hypothetical protein